MRAPQRFFLALLSAVVYAGCGGDGPAAPEVTDTDRFIGTWTVTSWVFTPIAGGAGVSQMPISFEITIDGDGDCVVDQHFAHDPGPRHLEGRVDIVTPGTVWIRAAEAGGDLEHFVGTFAFSNGDDTVKLVSVDDPDDGDDDWVFDFDGDGTPEPATLTITWQRQ